MRVVALCLLGLLTGSAQAQEATGLMAADEAMVQQLLKPRSVEDLTAEYESAKRRAEAADKEVRDFDAVLSVARARVDVKKGEIALLKTRGKLARKEKNTAKREEVERLLDREESGLRVFRAMEDTAQAQKDRAAAAEQFARARMKLQEAELDLARKHEARLAEVPAPGDAVAQAKLDELDARIRKSARSVLGTLRDYASTSDRLAKSTDDLAKARLDLLDAWEKYKGL